MARREEGAERGAGQPIHTPLQKVAVPGDIGPRVSEGMLGTRAGTSLVRHVWSECEPQSGREERV